jgi:hypothetical protein
VSLYVRTGKRHAVSVPLWFVPLYALGYAMALALALVVALVALAAVAFWSGARWLFARARPEAEPDTWTPRFRKRESAEH